MNIEEIYQPDSECNSVVRETIIMAKTETASGLINKLANRAKQRAEWTETKEIGQNKTKQEEIELER